MCTDKSTHAEHEYTESRLEDLRAEVKKVGAEFRRLKSEAESALESSGVAANVNDILDCLFVETDADENQVLPGTKPGMQLVLYNYNLPSAWHRIVIESDGLTVADYMGSIRDGYEVDVWREGAWIGELSRVSARINLKYKIQRLESSLGSLKQKLPRYRLGPDQEPDDHGRVGAGG